MASVDLLVRRRTRGAPHLRSLALRVVYSYPHLHGGHVTDRLEFHDSTLTEVNVTETHSELLLDAYIHRWQKVNDESQEDHRAGDIMIDCVP